MNSARTNPNTFPENHLVTYKGNTTGPPSFYVTIPREFVIQKSAGRLTGSPLFHCVTEGFGEVMPTNLLRITLFSNSSFASYRSL